jgi:membrane-bound lytic murein transglycosylase F
VASDSLVLCGAAVGQRRWAVRAGSDSLSGALRRWWRPSLLADVEREQRFLLSSRSVTRRVFSPMLSREKGIISSYDHLFKTYAPSVRWDWRLMAAQCYQESTFDPQARSWAGARGLMQLMPATAAQMGLSMADIHDPARNVAAATQYIGLLNTEFRDIPNRNERLRFVLAAYNGGYHHIRDAMALTQKHGGNPMVWEQVAPYVLRLSQPEYYRDEVVKNGYMRGSETCDYVERIIARWNGYRKTAR